MGTYDVIVRGGLILDGTGTPPANQDVGIRGDVIEIVGDLGSQSASLEISAAHLAVTPGFIDMHSHSDFTLPVDPRSMSKVRQGVTTEVIGQCGISPAPLEDEYREEWIQSVGFLPGELSWDWRSFGDYLARLRQVGLGVNVFPLVGHGAIRTAAMGFSDEIPTPEQMSTMESLLATSMHEGALGLSTGLIYPPGVYSQTDELVYLARVAGAHGGSYFSHIRGEGATLLEAVKEAIHIGREGRLPVQVSHLKAASSRNWAHFDQALSLIEGARDQGLDVGFDIYPYTAGNTVITALLPPWVMAGGPQHALARLRDESLHGRVGEEMLRGELLTDTGWDDILIGGCPKHPEFAGKSIAQLTQEARKPPLDWVLGFILSSAGEADIIISSQNEDNVRKGLAHPMATIGTDGAGLATTGPLGEGRPHPRNYGTYPRILGHYVRDEKLLSLEEAVRKMASSPAARLGLGDRGLVSPGYKADLVIFDPNTVDDLGGYGQTPRYPSGIEHVVVNGQVAIQGGEYTGVLSGRILGSSHLVRS
jgi:N-acyl-D-amino-acid deacylase